MYKIVREIKGQSLENFIDDHTRGWTKSLKANFWMYDGKEFDTKTEFKKYLKSKKIDKSEKFEVIKENREKLRTHPVIVIKSFGKNPTFREYKHKELVRVYKNRAEFSREFDYEQDYAFLTNYYTEYHF